MIKDDVLSKINSNHIARDLLNGDSNIVEKVNLDCLQYKCLPLGAKCHSSNRVLSKSDSPDGLKVKFRAGVKNSVVFIGAGFIGQKNTINVNGSNCIVYIGDNCILKSTTVSAGENNSVIIVGNSVTSQTGCKWTTGSHVGEGGSEVIIGDDCMFSMGVIIRGSDGHPIFDSEGTCVNTDKSSIVIEPYCWIGHNVAILKGVMVGACSILGYGSVLTKSQPRHSVVTGFPASSSPLNGRYWSRSFAEKDKRIMQHYSKKFAPNNLADRSNNTIYNWLNDKVKKIFNLH